MGISSGAGYLLAGVAVSVLGKCRYHSFVMQCIMGLVLFLGTIQPLATYAATTPANAHAPAAIEKAKKVRYHAKPTGGKTKKTAAKPARKLRASHIAPTKKTVKQRLPVVSATLLVDANTGKVLSQNNASKIVHPASLTKMMTLYLTFEALDQRRIKMQERVYASVRATAAQPSKLGLRVGESVTVHEAILSLVVKSANDVSVALAEHIGGTESDFAAEMTRRARMLGMQHTVFRNASGLPHPEQVTTAYDMAKLAIALRRDFPDHYHYFSNTSFTHKGRHIEGHNRITKHYEGAEGIKTGYIAASGFNIVSCAKRGKHRGIAVVLGGKTAAQRDQHARHLLDQFFKQKSDETVMARQ